VIEQIRLSDQGRSLPWSFPVAYLTVTHSTVALMVAVGLLGHPVLAADIALAHGATVATFHALSANARNLVLGESRAIAIGAILRMRLALVLPLAVAAYLLAVAGTGVPTWLALLIVLRRCVDWFNDVQLCKAEVQQRKRFAIGFFALQTFLVAVAAVALVVDWKVAPFAVAAWAVIPLAAAPPLRSELRKALPAGVMRTLRQLLPHAGSTAIGGLALYVFRLVVVLLLAKEYAGELFTAIAIGSFIGTAFANVFGPTIDLHERKTGHGLPRMVKRVLASILIVGIAMTAAAIMAPAALRNLGKPDFFWLACGLSLIGGVLMVQAQRIRLRVLRADDGRDVFGPEVLIHLGLLVSAPLLIRIGGLSGAAALYLVNAALAYLFYESARISQIRATEGAKNRLQPLRFAIGFSLVFPLFFQLSSGIFASRSLMLDSGGSVLSLPLPLSLITCFVGILLLADYRRATRSFAFVLMLFSALLLSTLVTSPEGQPVDRAKLLLFMQFLIPPFALVLGEMFEPSDGQARILERGIFWSCGIIMPAQLVASWLQGQAMLAHWLGFFSVYQHRQFVPVVLACAVLVAAPALKSDRVYRTWVLPLLVLSFVYSLASHSMLAISISSIGLLAFGLRTLRAVGLRTAITTVTLSLGIIGAQILILARTTEYKTSPKLESYAALKRERALPCTEEAVLHLADMVRSEGGKCLVHGQQIEPATKALIELGPRIVDEGDFLVVEGEMREGGLGVGLVRTSGEVVTLQMLEQRGAFRVELRPPDGHYRPFVISPLPPKQEADVTIDRIAWHVSPTTSSVRSHTRFIEDWSKFLPLNAIERLGDWMLFGRPIFSSVETFFFGHSKPLDRAIRSSAHNYYIDLAYNFGIVSLLPLFGLLAYLLRFIWARRRDIWTDDGLLWITGAVLFLFLVDSNFKVTLRQPYPGIFAFFLCGVLLSRLGSHRRPEEAAGRVGGPAGEGR